MNPMMMGSMFPTQDLFGFSQLMQNAMMNPEQGAQLFSMMGMQPPAPGMIGNGPAVNPFAGPFADAGMPQASPNERVSQSFDAVAPQSPTLPVPSATPQGPSMAQDTGSDSNPFPMPMPGSNPFPTPYGSPGGAQQATGGGGAKPTGTSSLANALKGISVPQAPEPQKVSSPSAPRPQQIDQKSQMVEMLMKMMAGTQVDPSKALRLGSVTPMPTNVRAV